MRISDWSSDVCSSDLAIRQCARHHPRLLANGKGPLMVSANYKVEISSHLLMRDAHAALWNPRSESTRWGKPPSASRSEEHTSELQSLMRISYAVFCLKKKKKIKTTNNQSINTRQR